MLHWFVIGYLAIGAYFFIQFLLDGKISIETNVPLTDSQTRVFYFLAFVFAFVIAVFGWPAIVYRLVTNKEN